MIYTMEIIVSSVSDAAGKGVERPPTIETITLPGEVTAFELDFVERALAAQIRPVLERLTGVSE